MDLHHYHHYHYLQSFELKRLFRFPLYLRIQTVIELELHSVKQKTTLK